MDRDIEDTVDLMEIAMKQIERWRPALDMLAEYDRTGVMPSEQVRNCGEEDKTPPST